MGVAGAGKTTVGRKLAARLGWLFRDGDDFHSAANKAKMAAGIPLDDDDRGPWLETIRRQMEECRAGGRSAVFACSALKARYRAQLLGPVDLLVYLKTDPATAAARVARRKGHYMKSGLVRSQFAALEPPREALQLDARLKPERIVDQIVARLGAMP